jgi:hypothetical protein
VVSWLLQAKVNSSKPLSRENFFAFISLTVAPMWWR